MGATVAQSWCRYGQGEPSSGPDVSGGEPSSCADVAGVSPVPVPAGQRCCIFVPSSIVRLCHALMDCASKHMCICVRACVRAADWCGQPEGRRAGTMMCQLRSQARTDDLPPNWFPVYDEARAVTYDPSAPRGIETQALPCHYET